MGEGRHKRKYVPLWSNFITMTGMFLTAIAIMNEVEGLLKKAEDRARGHRRELLRTLCQAGAVHNIEATRLIVGALAAELKLPPSPDEPDDASADVP